jgi:hypothetical protein
MIMTSTLAYLRNLPSVKITLPKCRQRQAVLGLPRFRPEAGRAFNLID